MWANNPIAVALVEAVGILKWSADGLRVLSLGCTTTALNVDWGRRHSLGKFGWIEKIADLFMAARDRYEIDRRDAILSLKGLGASEARKALPSLRALIFEEPVRAAG